MGLAIASVGERAGSLAGLILDAVSCGEIGLRIAAIPTLHCAAPC